MNDEIRPHRLHVPDDALDDLRDRLSRTRWPDEPPEAGDDYGIGLARVRALAERWADGYDWRAAEAAVNAHPNFVTDIDGETVHFLHVRSAEPDAVPLILTHGWPGSIVEFLPLIPLLRDFHLVIPSIPGFGPAGPTRSRGWDPARVARAWAVLMERLGYDRYAAQGGDWGAGISETLGAIAPEAVIGVHVNYRPHGPVDDVDGLTDEEKRRIDHIRGFLADLPAYMRMHATRPQVVGYALTDSPVAQLSWIADKVRDWADPAAPLPDDTLLTLASMHWFFATGGSSARLAFEAGIRPGKKPDRPPLPVPLAVAVFPADIVLPVRSVVERTQPVARWTEHERGGHFAALEAPEALAADVREFIAGLTG